MTDRSLPGPQGGARVIPYGWLRYDHPLAKLVAGSTCVRELQGCRRRRRRRRERR